MGSSNSKQNGTKENSRRRSSLKRILHISSRQNINPPPRPVSYAGIDRSYEKHAVSTRPMSMIDVVPLENFERKTSTDDLENETTIEINSISESSCSTTEPIIIDNISKSGSLSSDLNDSVDHTIAAESLNDEEVELTIIDKSNENDWKTYLPLTLEKLRTITILKDLIYERINTELIYILNRLIRLEKNDEQEEFLIWFFNEIEYYLHSMEDNEAYNHKSLLLRSIEQDRFDCTRYLLEHQLLSSKLDINTINEQGRHCLLMLSHKNGPVDLIQHLLTHHLSCLDTNKIDLNQYSPFHHACRHFNLSISELLLPYTNKPILQLENSELHSPLDYWLECLCSLKKLKPTHLQYDIDSLHLDYLLSNKETFNSNIHFLQTIINRGGQLTKLPLRYIRSILPQLTFEQKLSYVDHHVNLFCTLYKNRLSTLIHDYDHFKISIQASEILTEFIYALGTVQVEIQTRLAENACSDNEHLLKLKEHELLQLTMRMLYGNFFRLFECIYNNPDINVKIFHFEHIFRRVWIYWKEPVKIFIEQCKATNLSLKSLCRIELFKRLNNYPGDIQNLPINSFLKQFLTFDNQFFVVERKY